MLKKKSWIFVSLSLLIFFLGITGCGKKSVAPTSDTDRRNLVKNSSFEQNGYSTTQGWEGTSSSNVYRDVPTFAGSGLWCLRLAGGGCILGSAWYLLDSVEDGGIYELRCWMKNDRYGWGSIRFYNKRLGAPFKTVGTRSRNWTPVALIDTLSVAPGDSIYVLLEAGGFIWGRTGSAFFDLIKVIKIN